MKLQKLVLSFIAIFVLWLTLSACSQPDPAPQVVVETRIVREVEVETQQVTIEVPVTRVVEEQVTVLVPVTNTPLPTPEGPIADTSTKYALDSLLVFETVNGQTIGALNYGQSVAVVWGAENWIELETAVANRWTHQGWTLILWPEGQNGFGYVAERFLAVTPPPTFPDPTTTPEGWELAVTGALELRTSFWDFDCQSWIAEFILPTNNQLGHYPSVEINLGNRPIWGGFDTDGKTIIFWIEGNGGGYTQEMVIYVNAIKIFEEVVTVPPPNYTCEPVE